MKKKYLFLPFIIVLLLFIIFLSSCFQQPIATSGSITSFSYEYGSYFPGYFQYDIVKDNGRYQLSIQGYNDKAVNVSKQISVSDVDRLAKIINQYQIYQWNGFNQEDKGVMDGDGFTLHIVYEDGSIIDAHGYMKYPNNYREGHNKICSFFEHYY